MFAGGPAGKEAASPSSARAGRAALPATRRHVERLVLCMLTIFASVPQPGYAA